jgi:hypothetical protein
MDALVAREPGALPWAKQVRYTENGVPMMIGEGIWGSARKKSAEALRIADPETGTAVWYGVVFEHDAPAYYGMRVKVRDQRIVEVEALVARARNPGPFGDAANFKVDSLLSAPLGSAQRLGRERMLALADSYAKTLQLSDGTVSVEFAPKCRRIENGVDVTDGKGASAVVAAVSTRNARGCQAQLALGVYKPIDRVRGRRVVAVDPARGLIATMSLVDFGLKDSQYVTTDGQRRETQVKYPSTREMLDVFKLRDGKVQLVESISVFQPYGMPSAWSSTEPTD